MRLRSNPDAKDMLSSFINYVPEPDLFKERWSSYFGSFNEIQLEIGAGKGQFITTLAQHNPRINYIAIERCYTILLKLLKRIPEGGLHNLAVIRLDADYLEEFLREGEISKLYLNFSDPWPKKRHAKRRLTSPKYLRLYEKILKDGGTIEFKTDNRGLFDYSLEQFGDSAFELVATTYDLYNSDYLEGNIPTEYETRFHNLGTPINKLIARLDKKKMKNT